MSLLVLVEIGVEEVAVLLKQGGWEVSGANSSLQTVNFVVVFLNWRAHFSELLQVGLEGVHVGLVFIVEDGGVHVVSIQVLKFPHQHRRKGEVHHGSVLLVVDGLHHFFGR